MNLIEQHVNLLGKKVQDKVTGASGIVTSISFDLFGCIQGWVNQGLDSDGKEKNSQWYDISRFEILSNKKVIDTPNYQYGHIAEGKQGCAIKGSPLNN